MSNIQNMKPVETLKRLALGRDFNVNHIYQLLYETYYDFCKWQDDIFASIVIAYDFGYDTLKKIAHLYSVTEDFKREAVK